MLEQVPMLKYSLITLVLLPLICFATLKPKSDQTAQLKSLNATLERYRNTNAVESKLKQEISNVLDQNTTSEGQIWLSKGKMKIHFDKPELVDVVFDGEWLWQAQKTPEEFGGQWQVLKMKTKDLKKSNAAVALLFGSGTVESKFNIVDIRKSDDLIAFLMKPKDAKNSSLKKISVSIHPELKKVTSISLEDQAETKTRLSFTDTSFGAEVSDKMFKYTPPKNSEVNTL